MLIMTFPDPPFPLTQSTKFEVGDTFGINTSVDEDDNFYESDHNFIEVHDFDVTLEGRLYVDAKVAVTASLDLVENISMDPFDILHASSSGSPPSPSPECHNLSLVEYHVMLEGKEVDCIKSLVTFRGYDPSLDPYNLYLGNMPAKILFTIAFNHSMNFSKACDKFRRALTIISQFIFKCFYLYPSELHA